MPAENATPVPLVIRDAEPSEFSVLADLQIRSWRNVYRGIMSDTYLDDEIEEDMHARWQSLRPEGKDLVLVADQGGIRGFITVWCQPDPFIDNLHVDPGERSRGVGRRLMQTAAKRLLQNGFARVSLYVAAQNQRAANFYCGLEGRFGEVETKHQQQGGTVEAIEVVWDDLPGLAYID